MRCRVPRVELEAIPSSTRICCFYLLSNSASQLRSATRLNVHVQHTRSVVGISKLGLFLEKRSDRLSDGSPRLKGSLFRRNRGKFKWLQECAAQQTHTICEMSDAIRSRQGPREGHDSGRAQDNWKSILWIKFHKRAVNHKIPSSPADVTGHIRLNRFRTSDSMRRTLNSSQARMTHYTHATLVCGISIRDCSEKIRKHVLRYGLQISNDDDNRLPGSEARWCANEIANLY